MIRNITEIETERNRDGTEMEQRWSRDKEQDVLKERLPRCK
jgi:hypothetical protein